MVGQWLPLESNPEVIESYCRRLGLEGASFHDIFGLDAELLDMARAPTSCVLEAFNLYLFVLHLSDFMR